MDWNSDGDMDFSDGVITGIFFTGPWGWLVVALLLAIVMSQCGCVQLDPVEIKQNANLTCYYEDAEVASCEMRLVCNGLERDGKSVLDGDWKLCNKDNGVSCNVTTSTTGGAQ